MFVSRPLPASCSTGVSVTSTSSLTMRSPISALSSTCSVPTPPAMETL